MAAMEPLIGTRHGRAMRWRAICPEKGACADHLSLLRLGANEGTRCSLKDGTQIMLLAGIPPATTHEACDAALDLFSAGDTVEAAKSLRHASPLTVGALIRAHLEHARIRVPSVLAAENTGLLSARDLARTRLSCGATLPVSFVVSSSPHPEVIGQRFETGDEYLALHSERGLCVSQLTLDTCRVVSGGWMDLSTAALDTGSRAAQCVVMLELEPPFDVRVTPTPPADVTYAYCKVHALGPAAHHHALLLALPREQVPCDAASGCRTPRQAVWMPRLTTAQQLEYHANLVRRCIERGRLFGGGADALRAALRQLLDEQVGGIGAAFTTVLLSILETVRVYAVTQHCLPFHALVAFTILASSCPSWVAPSAVVEALIATAVAAQAADTRRSRMQWRQWRLPSTEAADGNLQFGGCSQGGTCVKILDAMRLLSCGFVPAPREQLEMILKYADVFLRRGGLPLSRLPQPSPTLEQVIGNEYQLAALSSDVFPRMVLYLQAALPLPPRCSSGDLKDNNMRNLSFFVEQTLYNIRDQKEAKIRGGYIEQGDMERLVVYMDDKHYTDGADLAPSRALGDDSALQHANLEGFVRESECQMGSERCHSLRDVLRAVQTFILYGPGYDVQLKPRFIQSASSTLAVGTFAIPKVDESAGLEAFLSVFGASLDLPADVTVASRPPLRVTCANLGDPSNPLVVQRSRQQDGENHDPYAVSMDPSEVRRAVQGYCAAFPGTAPISLPRPPAGLYWGCGNSATVRVEPFFGLDSDESTSHAAQLRFFIGSVEVPVFNAASVLRPCPSPTKSWDLGEVRPLLCQTLYLESCESQIMLLWQLRERAEEFRMGSKTHMSREDFHVATSKGLETCAQGVVVPHWVPEAVQSPISALVWQEVYARLLLEEEHDGEHCLSLAHAHPYQGVLLRVVLLLQLLYFDVLIPTRDELIFRIRRHLPDLATRHAHLVTSLKALAFGKGGHNGPRSIKLSGTPGTLRARLATDLYSYQVEAVSRLVHGRNSGMQGSLDASSLGAGKTLVALRFCLALAQEHGGGRFLVLVGSENLMEGWREQIFEHLEDLVTLLQQENGVLRGVRKAEAKSPIERKAGPKSPRGGHVDQYGEPYGGVTEFVISTYSRAMRHPFSCTFLLVVADECLSLQNADSLQSAAAWRLVTRSLYGGHFISGTMFRRHYQDLLEMLKMLRSSLPLRAEYIHAYFRAHLIMYSREARKWETRLEAMDIPESIRGQYLEVLDECRGRDAQNYSQVLGRMRRVLNDALRNGRLLAERIWSAVVALRANGYKPIVFASTEYEAETFVRHIGCASRYRHDRHPQHCPGCDICKGFNKFMVGQETCAPIAGSDAPSADPLTVFTVGADAQGLNLQSFGDALVLRPVQTDTLIQMMGRLDRPGQSSTTLCRAIVYLRRTHEEAEVAHLQKYAAFWNLHIRPLARDIVQATMDASAMDTSVSECFERRVSSDPQAASQAGPTKASSDAQQLCKIPAVQVRHFVQEEGDEDWWESVDKRKVGGRMDDSEVKEHRWDKQKLQAQVKNTVENSCLEYLPSLRMTHESIRQGLSFILQHDPQFQHILQLIGPPTDLLELLRSGAELQDAFTTLAQTICHQQLSLRVCQQMFERLLDMCGDRGAKLLDPSRVVAMAPEKIREFAQLSFRKISYIQHAAKRFASGELTSRFFEEASDEEVRQALIALPGIGEWTAEMFLIFQLHRHGAHLYGDVAFQKAMKMVYNIQAPLHVTRYCEVSWMPSRAQMEKRVRRWGPYSSIASLYLLRVADNERSAIFLPEDATPHSDSESGQDLCVKRQIVKRVRPQQPLANSKRRRKVHDARQDVFAEPVKIPARELQSFGVPLKKAPRRFGQKLRCASDAVIELI